MRGTNPIVLILAVAGVLVVLGFVLKVAFKLIGLAIIVAIGIMIYYFVQGVTGRRP